MRLTQKSLCRFYSTEGFPEGTFAEDKDEDGNVIDAVAYEDLRWHNFVHFSTEKMYHIVKDFVFKFIREMHNGENNAFSRFMTDAKLDIPSGKILEKVIRGLDDDELNLDNKEIMGDVYEYLLAKLSVNGTNGQFRTPRHIINMMVQLMQPKLGEKICDPAMGSAGFLMESAKYIAENQKGELNNKESRYAFNNEMFYGNETDPDMLRIGTMNMTLHDVSNPQIYYKNSLTDDNKDEFKYDLILANPPFSGSLDANDLAKSLKDICPSKSTELLFMALFLRSLKIGGRCASIVPVGVVNNTNEKAYTIIRKELVENQRLRAIIYRFQYFGGRAIYFLYNLFFLILIKAENIIVIDNILFCDKERFFVWRSSFFFIQVMESFDYIRNIVSLYFVSLVVKRKSVSFHIVKPYFIGAAVLCFIKDNNSGLHP